MPAKTTTEKIKKSITIYSALGILIIGMVVSAVGIIPLYEQLRKEKREELAQEVTVKQSSGYNNEG